MTLDTVVSAFNEGLPAERIVEQYPSLILTDVYGAISYYQRHRAEVERYLDERHRQAEKARRQNEARFDPRGIREKLLARRLQ